MKKKTPEQELKEACRNQLPVSESRRANTEPDDRRQWRSAEIRVRSEIYARTDQLK